MGKAVWRMNCPTHIQWFAKEGGKSRKQSERKLETAWESKWDQAVECGIMPLISICTIIICLYVIIVM